MLLLNFIISASIYQLVPPSGDGGGFPTPQYPPALPATPYVYDGHLLF